MTPELLETLKSLSQYGIAVPLLAFVLWKIQPALERLAKESTQTRISNERIAANHQRGLMIAIASLRHLDATTRRQANDFIHDLKSQRKATDEDDTPSAPDPE